jgi:hypothetical protein
MPESMRETILEPARAIPVAARPQVVVVGSGAGGYPAAISAARNGAEVLLLERNAMVGGTGPMSFVTEFLSCENLSGIALEVAERLARAGGATAQFRPEYFNLAFDPEILKLVVVDMLHEAGVRILLHTMVVGALMDGDRVTGVVIENKSGRQAVLADVVIDASGDADVAAFAGAAMQPRETPQPMMMLFRIGGVDWRAVDRYAHANPDEFVKSWGIPPGHFDGARCVHVGGWFSLVKAAKERGALPADFGNYLSLFGATPSAIQNGVGFIYAVRVLNRDATNAADLSAAEIEGRLKARDLLPFLKTVPGLESSFLIDMAPMIGVRDSRRIVGDYVLTVDDIFAARRFDDEIALKVYRGPAIKGWVRHPTDGSEGSKQHGLNEAPVSVVTVGIPYRCLLPAGLDGLIVAGKTVSFEAEAHQRVRLMPECMAFGEAAGAAAAIAVGSGVPPRQVEPTRLRAALSNQGLNLDRAAIHIEEVKAILAERGIRVADPA